MIRNLSKSVRRIRFHQPKSTLSIYTPLIAQYFKIDYDMQKGVAAGLSIKIVVVFQTYESVAESYSDSFFILSEDGYRFEVQLSAVRVASILKYDRSLDFGYIQNGKSCRRVLNFVNQGECTSTIALKLESSFIELHPNELTLQPHESKQVDVVVKYEYIYMHN